MFENKRKSALGLVNESRTLLTAARKAVINRNSERKITIKKDLINKVTLLEKIVSTIDSDFKRQFLTLYKIGKDINIDIPSGSANVTNSSKLVYHWNAVQKGGLFTGLGFKSGHRMPKVSVMDGILNQLVGLIETAKKKLNNNKKASNEAEAVRKANKNKVESNQELSELNKLSDKLNDYQRRLQNNGGVEMTNLSPKLTSNQRKNVYSKFSGVVSVGPTVSRLKNRGITNANISAFKSKTATDRQLSSIARAMNYNLK